MKYLKKTTALLLSVLLLFSAMITGFTVSADGNTATITAASVEVEIGGTVDVPVTVDTTGLTAAIFTVTAEEGLIVNSATVDAAFTEVYTDVYGQAYTFAVTAAGDADVTGTATIVTLNVTTPADAEAEQAFAVTVSDATAADYAEADVTVSTVDGAVTVKAAECAHENVTYTSNEDGTHNGVCECGEAVATNETCDQLNDGACSKCGYVAETECEHEWDFVSATAAEGTGSSGNYTTTKEGEINLVCSICGEEDTQAVYYDERSRSNTVNITVGAEIVFNATIKLNDLNRVGGDHSAEPWSDVFWKVTDKNANGDVINAYTLDSDNCSMSGSDYRFSIGVAPYYIGNDLVLEVYTYNTDDQKWYSGYITTSGVLSYAKGMLSTASESFRNMLVDLTAYGAAAQANMNYDTENPVDGDLVVDGVDYSQYITTGTTTLENNKKMASSSSADYPVSFSTFSCAVESKLAVNVGFQFGSKYYEQYQDQYDDMYVVVSYENIKGETIPTTYYNASSNPDAVNTFELTDGTRKFSLKFDTFNAGDMRSVLTFEVYTGDGVLLNSETTYSVESYAYTIFEENTNTNLMNLMNEMIQYGDSVRVYLAENN